jgi:hypothetical protein
MGLAGNAPAGFLVPALADFGDRLKCGVAGTANL